MQLTRWTARPPRHAGGRALVCCALLVAALFASTPLFAQGVTTSSINGVVRDEQGLAIPGASITAVHEPSQSTYEAVSNEEGRFTIPGMRVGGPYTITATLAGFQPQAVKDVFLNLGVATDVELKLGVAAVAESVTVSAVSDPVFSSARTGAATAVSREDLATLPTVSGRISDITRLTPQASGSSFAGQDNRLNNVTVDGSYFNNSFGLGSAPGERTNVAPISLESLEQVQVSIAPFDVRQGSFIGAAVNSVTRSGTNQFRASVYHRFRSDNFVGTEAKDQAVNPGTFTFRDTGGWGSGPIIKNKLFIFGNYENEEDKRPLTTYRANLGGEAPTGNVTRVLKTDLDELTTFLKQNFDFEAGPYEGLQDLTPAKRYLFRTDYNLTGSNKVSFRYNQLDSSSNNYVSGSSSAGIGRPTFTNNYLVLGHSTYTILENIKSGIGEWNSVFGSNLANNLIVGLTSNDESRGDVGKLFPFVDILGEGGTAYTSFGTEPFSVQNELRYKTFQMQDSFTKFGAKHTLTFGGSTQRYRSENVFWSCCPQSDYTYNSLADFYTDARDYLANPNRTTSPVTLRRFKLRYSDYPGLDKPLQPLQVWYSGAYAQDEWRPRRDLTVTAGVRADVSAFKNTAYQNPKADAVTFRDENGNPVQYQTGQMPKTKVLWSPRVAANWDLGGMQRTQVRAGTGLFTGPPLYVWISNQLGNTGVLIGEIQVDNTNAFPFNPNPDRYKPAPSGQGASSYELDVTDPDFRFPQVWRTNLAVDHRLPWGLTGTLEFLYNKDVNGVYYINANLPAAQSTFTGVDNRARWVGTSCGTPSTAGCVTRINNAPGNQITNALVIKNQDIGKSWNISASVVKAPFAGFSIRGAYSYGDAKDTIDPGSTALSSFANNQIVNDPNNPGLGRSAYAQGHRAYIQGSYTRSYFGMAATTMSVFWEYRRAVQNFANNASYVFSGDANGDTYSGNDLIYVPRDTSEMNFVSLTLPPAAGGRTFTPAEQAAAFEAYIQQDPYLSKHRGQYAERGELWLPMFGRMDFSLVQDVFKNIGGKRNAGQFRIDITNFGNLLNHNWGVSQKLVVATTQANGAQILASRGADALGRLSYQLATVNNRLVTNTFQTNASISDVYQFLLSFRYSFN